MSELKLFDNEPSWVRHWAGMPEYTHEDLTPARSLVVHFESERDIAAFAKLVGQTITPNTKSLWFPEQQVGRYADKRYAYVPE